MAIRKTGKLSKVFNSLNHNFDVFVNNIDFMVASVLTLILMITFKDAISHELTATAVFLLSAIIIQLMLHDALISILGAFLITTLYNVMQQKRGTLEAFTDENKKISKIVETLSDEKENIAKNVMTDEDLKELLKDELGDGDDDDAAKRREKLSVNKMTPSEAQRELFKLVDVGKQLQQHMEQMVPGLRKAGTVMKMLKTMKNV